MAEATWPLVVAAAAWQPRWWRLSAWVAVVVGEGAWRRVRAWLHCWRQAEAACLCLVVGACPVLLLLPGVVAGPLLLLLLVQLTLPWPRP